MMTEPQVRTRRKEIARQLLEFRAEGRPDEDYEPEQARHWFYCLSEVLGNDRRDYEDIWQWAQRVSDEAIHGK